MTLKPQIVNFNEVWSGILETVKSVISCYPIVKSVWMDRFLDVYSLCVARPEPLMDRLYQETKIFLVNHVNSLYEEVIKDGEQCILANYHRHWIVYNQGANFIDNLYGYLNNQYVKKQKPSDADMEYGESYLGDSSENLMEIGELALDAWKNLMIEKLRTTLTNLLLVDVQIDRFNGSINESVIHGVIKSFVEVNQYKPQPLQLYEEIIETPYREQLGQYYRKETAILIDECTFSEYLEKAIQRLRNENQRSRRFLYSSSYEKMTRECEGRIVSDHLNYLTSECMELVESERKNDLKNMYILLKPTGNLFSLVELTMSYIRKIAENTVQMQKEDNVSVNFVEQLLKVHDQFTEFISSVYQSDQLFIGARDMAFADAINRKSNNKSICRSPELVAKYCDNLLKKNSKGFSESEQDEKLSRAIIIFKYLDDKDVFQKYYSRMLAKRLIYGQSVSMDSEEAMINRLKQACGFEFTTKLHRMFTDMSVSSDLQAMFLSSLDCSIGFNLSMLVLQAGAWPLPHVTSSILALPQELEQGVNLFEKFYGNRFSGRKLTWMYHYCTADLKFNYLSRSYFVTVSMYHMAILLLFNKSATLSFEDVSQGTQLADKELLRQLQALVDTKIITTQGSLNVDSTLHLNTNYVNKRAKFKILSAQVKDPNTESEMSQNMINEDRKMHLQAAIVRIMKARKVLKHTLLINEVIAQLKNKFSPPVHLIKKSIEILIEKQYLERTSTNTDEYSYIA